MKTNELMPLNPHDLAWCLRRAPKEVLELLKRYPRKSCVAGGFIRACIANEDINDIDIFACDKTHAALFAATLSNAAAQRKGRPQRVVETDNAYTIFGFPIDPQVIHRWTFADVMDVIPSFDFTVACAVIFWCNRLNRWEGFCAPTFYSDLAAKRLVYRAPVREEEPGGSMLRVLKFYQKGYRIPLDSLGLVMARCCKDIDEKGILKLMNDHCISDDSAGRGRETALAKIITGRLVEVDPAIDPSHIAHLPTLGEDKA